MLAYPRLAFVDTSVRDLAEAKIKSNKQEIQHAEDRLNIDEMEKGQKISVLKEEQVLSRENSTVADHFVRRDKIKRNIGDKIDDNNN